MLKLIPFIAASAISAKSISEYQTPPPIFDPSTYTTWVQEVTTTGGLSRKSLIDVPFKSEDGSDDNVHMYRVDLVGNTYERGFAHGALLTKEIFQLAEVGLTKYLIDAIIKIDISDYPEPLQNILKIIKIKGIKAAPETLQSALQWVYDNEVNYMPSYLIEEMEAIGDGMCSTLGGQCNATEMGNMVKRFNMFPELIQMACTAFGAWGPATASGDLIQLRALDLGGGPFANYTVVQVNRNSSMRAFVSVSFPGMVGVITGVAQDGIAVSEKVWYISGQEDPPGAYDGEPDVFVLRDILQFSNTRLEAEEYMQSVRRTWGIWVGVGDFTTQVTDLVGYQQASAVPYTDETMPSVTSAPYLPYLVYVDKHSQPSSDPTLPTVLADMYGAISLSTAPIITQYHQTGDHHIAFYDFQGTGEMILSIGRINRKGEYGPEGGDLESWMAYNRPYLRFNLSNLWNGL